MYCLSDETLVSYMICYLVNHIVLEGKSCSCFTLYCEKYLIKTTIAKLCSNKTSLKRYFDSSSKKDITSIFSFLEKHWCDTQLLRVIT